MDDPVNYTSPTRHEVPLPRKLPSRHPYPFRTSPLLHRDTAEGTRYKEDGSWPAEYPQQNEAQERITGYTIPKTVLMNRSKP